MGAEHVGYEGNQGSEGLRDSDNMKQRAGQEVPPGIEHSIRADASCPETTLIMVMNGGGYLLVAYPQGEPAAFVVKEEADLLKQALAGAFGKPNDEEAASGNNSGTSKRRTVGTTQARP